MLNRVNLVTVFIIAGPVAFHTVNLHLQIRFPFGIGKFRLVDVLILRQISRGGNPAEASAGNIGERRKHRSNQEEYQKEQNHNPADDRMAFHRMDNSHRNSFCGSCRIFYPRSGFFCLPGRFGILAFDFLFLPHPGKDILFKLGILM